MQTRSSTIRGIWIVALFLAVITLVSCSRDTIEATPLTPNQGTQGTSIVLNTTSVGTTSQTGQGSTGANTSLNPCADVVCTGGKTCKNGACVCSTGRDCAGTCIGASQCCSNSDCGANKRCTSNQCTDEACAYNEVKNAEGGCDCVQGTRRCLAQNKCIPTGKCCSNADCPGENDAFCEPIQARAIFCRDTGGLFCKTMLKNVQEDFETFNAKVQDIREAGLTITQIGNTTYRLLPNKRIPIGNATLFVKAIEQFGGTCKKETGLVSG